MNSIYAELKIIEFKKISSEFENIDSIFNKK